MLYQWFTAIDEKGSQFLNLAFLIFAFLKPSTAAATNTEKWLLGQHARWRRR
jgi:hypothetical protein